MKPPVRWERPLIVGANAWILIGPIVLAWMSGQWWGNPGLGLLVWFFAFWLIGSVTTCGLTQVVIRARTRQAHTQYRLAAPVTNQSSDATKIIPTAVWELILDYHASVLDAGVTFHTQPLALSHLAFETEMVLPVWGTVRCFPAPTDVQVACRYYPADPTRHHYHRDRHVVLDLDLILPVDHLTMTQQLTPWSLDTKRVVPPPHSMPPIRMTAIRRVALPAAEGVADGGNRDDQQPLQQITLQWTTPPAMRAFQTALFLWTATCASEAPVGYAIAGGNRSYLNDQYVNEVFRNALYLAEVHMVE